MVDGWALFIAMDTQWDSVSVGMAGTFRSGLKYQSLPVVAASCGIEYPLTPSVFLDLQTLEREALRIWSARRS